jgi:hypothetical protein
MNKTRKKKYLLNEAICQRLGYEFEDIATADAAAGIRPNLSKYLNRHPHLRLAFDRGRFLRVLVKTAPNCLIYEAAQRLKDLGFKQFQSARDLRDYLDKDKEANELWESARVNGAIENRESLRRTANEGNVKAIELLEKWSVDRQKETGEAGGQNFQRISTNQMAELFGVSRQTILEWNKDKGMPRNTDDSYNLHSAILWFEDYIKKLAVRGHDAVGPLNPFQAVKTERERLKLEQDRGDLLERAAVISFQVTMIQNVVNAFNAITDLANRVFGQPREQIVGHLEDFRDEVLAKLQHVPAELKLNGPAENKLVELWEVMRPQNESGSRQ